MRTSLLLPCLLCACIADEGPDEAPDEAARVMGWSPPARIAAVSQLGVYDSDPAVTADGLELFFISDRQGAWRIYTSTRTSTDLPWGPAVGVTSLWGIAGTLDTAPELSHDALTIFFARAQIGMPGPAIYTATRPIRSLAWSAPTRVTELDPLPAASPHLSRDGLKLYFTRADSAVDRDLYTATRPNLTAAWRNVRPVNRLNSPAWDDEITTARNDREAYFESDRGGATRLYRSTRTADTAWSTPEVVDDLVGAFVPDLSPDGRYVVVMMSANGGDPDLYESER